MAQDEMLVVNFIKVRDGVPPERFETFSRSRDLPTWRAKDVVVSFDTYRVIEADAAMEMGDFVEVMRVRSWSEWEAVSRTDPDVVPLATEFEKLADPAAVRRARLTTIDDGSL